MADDSIDIASILRQKQIMDQLNQITSQGAGAALLGGGANLRAFDDTGGGSQTTSTGVEQQKKGGGLLSAILGGLGSGGAGGTGAGGESVGTAAPQNISNVPGIKQVDQAKAGVENFIGNKIAGFINPQAALQQQNQQALMNQAKIKQQGWPGPTLPPLQNRGDYNPTF